VAAGSVIADRQALTIAHLPVITRILSEASMEIDLMVGIIRVFYLYEFP
jgi:hypothetical protein